MKMPMALFFAADTQIKILKRDSSWSRQSALSTMAEDNQRQTTHTPKK